MVSSFFVFCDAAEPWQIGLQDPATPVVEGIIFFHDFLNSFIVLIVIFVLFMLIKICTTFEEKKIQNQKFLHILVY